MAKRQGPNSTPGIFVENAEVPEISQLLPDHGKPWYKVPHLLKLNLLLMVPLLSSCVSGFDGSVINGMQSLPYWNKDFDNPSGSVLGLLANVQVIGGVASLPFAPIIADRFGRRPGIAVGSIFIIVGALIQGVGHSIGTFLGGRGLVGFGSGFISIAAAPMVAELAYPSHRPIITAIYNANSYLGSNMAGSFAYGTFRIASSWGWRIPCLFQVAPSIIQLSCIYLVPESPRWLVAHDRPEEAQRILSNFHAGSDEPDELVRAEMREITVAIQSEKLQNTSSYLDFFKTAGNRHRLFVCTSIGFMIQWCGNGLILTYFAQDLKSIGITDPEIQNFIGGGLQNLNYMVAICSAFLIDRCGRRGLFLFSIVGMIISFVTWISVSAYSEQQKIENKDLSICVVTMIVTFLIFYNISMIPVSMTYLLEVLPYTLRAKGVSIFNVAQFSGIIFNRFANPVALDSIGWKYYIYFACLLVFWLVGVYNAYPETRGLSLEEVAVVFDKEDAMRENASQR